MRPTVTRTDAGSDGEIPYPLAETSCGAAKVDWAHRSSRSEFQRRRGLRWGGLACDEITSIAAILEATPIMWLVVRVQASLSQLIVIAVGVVPAIVMGSWKSPLVRYNRLYRGGSRLITMWLSNRSTICEKYKNGDY